MSCLRVLKLLGVSKRWRSQDRIERIVLPFLQALSLHIIGKHGPHVVRRAFGQPEERLVIRVTSA